MYGKIFKFKIIKKLFKKQKLIIKMLMEYYTPKNIFQLKIFLSA